VFSRVIRDDNDLRPHQIEKFGAATGFAAVMRGDEHICANEIESEVGPQKQLSPTFNFKVARKDNFEGTKLNNDDKAKVVCRVVGTRNEAVAIPFDRNGPKIGLGHGSGCHLGAARVQQGAHAE
jgi:hypothetical protein